jgi:uncharacterized protein
MTILTGFLIAAIIGMTGIGGGTLTAPVLLLFLGVPAPVAVGTSLIFISIVKLFAAPVFAVRKQVDYRILGLLLAGGLPGAILGAVFLGKLQSNGSNGLLLVVLGLTIAFSATVNLFKKDVVDSEKSDKSHRLPFASFPIGLEVGFSSAGAGALGTLALLHWTKLKASQVGGTDLLFGFALAVAGGAIHASRGAVDPVILKGLAMGGIPGALVGSWLATVLPSRHLRRGLAVWLMYLGGQLFYRGIGALAK